MNAKSFVCSDCGARKPASQLSSYSLQLAGASSPREAIVSLQAADLVCSACMDDEAGSVGLWGDDVGRSEVERWQLSGLVIDPARLAAYRLNY